MYGMDDEDDEAEGEANETLESLSCSGGFPRRDIGVGRFRFWPGCILPGSWAKSSESTLDSIWRDLPFGGGLRGTILPGVNMG